MAEAAKKLMKHPATWGGGGLIIALVLLLQARTDVGTLTTLVSAQVETNSERVATNTKRLEELNVSVVRLHGEVKSLVGVMRSSHEDHDAIIKLKTQLEDAKRRIEKLER